MASLYESADQYLKGPECMRMEVDMWHAGASLLLQEVIRKQRGSGFGGLYGNLGLKAKRELPIISILDVCCGPGNFLNYVTLVYDFNKIEALGIDINDQFIENAKKRFKKSIFSFITGDAIGYQFGKRFDFILAGSAYHHIEDENKVKFITNMRKHLKENGRIIMCENFIPEYSNVASKRDAINRFYKALKIYFSTGNATPEAIDILEEVHQLELTGEKEHKVSFAEFEQDLNKSGLEIVVDRIIWQPKEFRQSNAGSHVLMLR